MTRRDSNTKVYKVRKDAVDMFVGYLIASCHYATNSDLDTYKDKAIQEFSLTNVEVAIGMQSFANYLSHQSE
jgi:hypothetical protein